MKIKALFLSLVWLAIGGSLSAQTNSARMLAGVNKVTACPYTLQITDTLMLVAFNVGSSCAVTLPATSTPGYGVGAIFSVKNDNSSFSVTITPSSGTISGSSSLTLSPGQGADIYSGLTGYEVQGGTGAGAVTAAAQYSFPYYSAAGIATNLAGIGPCLTNQSAVAVNSSIPVCAGAGIAGSTVSSTPYTVQCDSTTQTLDRGTTLKFQTGASVITVPDPTTSGCGGFFVFSLLNDGAGTLTVNQGTSATFDVLNGSTNLQNQTSFTLTNGQSATINSPDNMNWNVRIPGGGSIANGTQGEPCVYAGASPTCAPSAIVFDASQFSGDSSAKANSCSSAAGGGTCNATALTGSPTVGTPISLSTALILPNSASWQYSFTGGTQSAITVNDTGSLFTLAAQNRMKIQNASIASGLKYLLNIPSCCYFHVNGVTFYNPSTATAGAVACNIASGADGATIDNVNCLDYIAGENSWKISGGCCSMAYHSDVGNGNQSGGVTAAISGGVNGVWFHDLSLGHPASSTNIMTCSTSTVDFSIFGFYSEGNNSDTTTPFYAIDGCRNIGVFGNEIKAETASSTAPAYTLSNTLATGTSFTLDNFYAALNFTLPMTAVQNSNKTYCPTEATSAIVSGTCNVMTDSSGNLTHYGSLYNWEDADVVFAARSVVIPNTSTGTTLHKLVKLTSTGAQILTTTDTFAFGICDQNCTTTGAGNIATSGQALCVMDGNLATTPGDYVIISQSVAGDCRDAGAARPVGAQIIGQMSPAATGSSSGNQWVILEVGSQPAFGNTTGTSSATNTTPVVGGGTCCTAVQLQEVALTSNFFNNLSQAFNLDMSGVYTTAAAQTPTLNFVVKACTVSGCGSGSVVTLFSATTGATTASSTNNQWRIIGHVVPTATGASGAFEAHANFIADLGSGPTIAQTVYQDSNTATVGGAINLAGPLYIDTFVTTSTTNAGNSVTERDTLVMPAPQTQPTQNWYDNGDTTTTAAFSAASISFGLIKITNPVSFSALYYDVSTLDASNTYYLGLFSCPNQDCSQPSVTATAICSNQITVTATGARNTSCTQTTPVLATPGTYIIATTANATTALLKAGNQRLLPFSTNLVAGGGGAIPGSFTTPTAGSTVVNTGQIAIGLH